MSRDDWPRLGRLVRNRREMLSLTQQDAVNRVDGSISVATWRNIETATNPPFRRAGLLALCRALDWEPGSVERILAGGEPIEVAPDSRPASDFDAVDFEQRLSQLEADVAQVMAEMGIQRRPRPSAGELRERLDRATGRDADPRQQRPPA